MSDAIAVTDDGGVRTIRMNRPEKKNALTLAMYGDITSALRECDHNDAIRCIMIAGTPGAFCAGNDITDFSQGLGWRARSACTRISPRASPPAKAAGRGSQWRSRR